MLVNPLTQLDIGSVVRGISEIGMDARVCSSDDQFGSNCIHHLFCKHCGVRPFAHGYVEEMDAKLLPRGTRRETHAVHMFGTERLRGDDRRRSGGLLDIKLRSGIVNNLHAHQILLVMVLSSLSQ